MKPIHKKILSITSFVCISAFVVNFLVLKTNSLQQQIDELSYLIKTPVYFRNSDNIGQLVNFKENDKLHQYNLKIPPGFIKFNDNTLIYIDENGLSQGIYFNSQSVVNIIDSVREKKGNIQEIVIDGKFYALRKQIWEVVEVVNPTGGLLRYYLTEFDGDKYGIIFSFPKENSQKYIELFHSILNSWLP